MTAIVKPVTLKSAAAIIAAAISDAMQTAEVAVQKAIRVGHLLVETKPLLERGDFQDWIEKEFPQITYRTAARWMQAAERCIAATGIEPHLLSAPISELLAAEAPAGASAGTLAARQQLFDFMRDKTIKDCLTAVVVDGDDAHRITRAANGRKLGGHKGEDRKDWPKYIRVLLRHSNAHLKSWKNFTPAQREATRLHFADFFGGLPEALTLELRETINKVIKAR